MQSLEEFPEICGDMPCLSVFYVKSTWIRNLPPYFSSLSNLQLIECEVLENFPDASQNLRYLRISGCNKPMFWIGKSPHISWSSKEAPIFRNR